MVQSIGYAGRGSTTMRASLRFWAMNNTGDGFSRLVLLVAKPHGGIDLIH